MNNSIITFDNANNTADLNFSQSVENLAFIGKFTSKSQRDAYRTRAILEIRKALRKASEF